MSPPGSALLDFHLHKHYAQVPKPPRRPVVATGAAVLAALVAALAWAGVHPTTNREAPPQPAVVVVIGPPHGPPPRGPNWRSKPHGVAKPRPAREHQHMSEPKFNVFK